MESKLKQENLKKARNISAKKKPTLVYPLHTLPVMATNCLADKERSLRCRLARSLVWSSTWGGIRVREKSGSYFLQGLSSLALATVRLAL